MTVESYDDKLKMTMTIEPGETGREAQLMKIWRVAKLKLSMSFDR